MTETQVVEEFTVYLNNIGVADKDLSKAIVSYKTITKVHCENWFQDWFLKLTQPLEQTFSHVLGFELVVTIHLTPLIVMSEISEIQAILSGWIFTSSSRVLPEIISSLIVKELRFDIVKNIQASSGVLFKIDLGNLSTCDLGLLGLLREATLRADKSAVTVLDLTTDETPRRSSLSMILPTLILPTLQDSPKDNPDGQVWFSYVQNSSRAFERVI